MEDDCNESQRLLHLLHKSRGKAKMAREECVVLPPELRYGKTYGMLTDILERTHKVARSMLGELFEGTREVELDANAFLGLALRMKCGAIILEQLEYTSDHNLPANPQR